jgi:hypothetical protein
MKLVGILKISLLASEVNSQSESSESGINMDPKNILEINLNDKLEITINNLKPVILTDLTIALLGVSQQFQKFIECETTEQHQIGSELYIKEVRSGSIIVEVVAQAMPVIPLLWQGGSLLEWVNYSKSVIEWLNGKLDKPPKDVTKHDLKQWSNILEPVAKDHGSQMNFTVSSGGQVINQIFINSEQANIAQNSIRREIDLLSEPDDHVKRKCVMTWYQTKFDESSQTGNKVVIESISKSPIKVIFENGAVRKALMAGDSRFNKAWHELAYIVDVRIQTIRGVPKVYTVIDYYDQDTFDPSE